MFSSKPECLVSRIAVGEQRVARSEGLFGVVWNGLGYANWNSAHHLRVGLRPDRHVNDGQEIAVVAVRITDPGDYVSAAGRRLRQHNAK